MITLIGSGGHASVVAECAILNNRRVEYLDENAERACLSVKHCTREQLKDCIGEKDYHVAIGNNHVRSDIVRAVERLPTTLIHPKSCVSASAQISFGCFVAAGAVVEANALVHSGCIINTNASVNHDCNLAEFVHVGPGATLCGNVSIGKNTLIGANATLLPNVTIAENCIVGAGAVVTKSFLQNNCTIVGVPAQVL